MKKPRRRGKIKKQIRGERKKKLKERFFFPHTFLFCSRLTSSQNRFKIKFRRKKKVSTEIWKEIFKKRTKKNGESQDVIFTKRTKRCLIAFNTRKSTDISDLQKVTSFILKESQARITFSVKGSRIRAPDLWRILKRLKHNKYKPCLARGHCSVVTPFLWARCMKANLNAINY